ncbi:SusC/RagA family TonB-linked outer membrane protein [Chitinophaga sp. Mgbs1]|uniref:SusC/RagA family TonB-linked outer membrane protein n=1 Tax=Chitinophaga solisilvae TaxID=1233460 RepID=A0A433WBX7_9BACT|nr:SusC/RagA family TonB-linked outer membrane protein [Chitinophaga solisilvae]
MKKMSGFPLWRGKRRCVMSCMLLSLFLCFTVAAYAQQDDLVLAQKITYRAANESLAKILKDIRALSGVRFTYNNDLIRKHGGITIDVKSATLRSVLSKVLENTGIAFTEVNGGVLIYPEENKGKSADKLHVLATGQVKAANGEPLPGVTIQAVNSRAGTVTGPDGIFSLLAEESEQLRISLIGMETIYRKAGDARSFIEVVMDTASRGIREVVINGYQKIDSRMSTAAVFKLNAAEIMQPGQPSIDQMLQGKVPGLLVMNNSGSVNARPTIRMRGTSTFVGNAAPLWVIDGVVRPDPVDISATQLNNVISDAQTGNFSMIGGAVSGLNPYDVESITFLKDAAATAIYGVRAANGVIVVTTKRGKEGPAQFSYTNSITMRQRPSYHNLHLMNSKDRVRFSRELLADSVIYGNIGGSLRESISYEGILEDLYAGIITEAEFKRRVQKLETNNTDWFKVLFRNALSMTHSLSMSGGGGKTTYYASLNYSDNRGAARLDGSKMYGASVSINTQASERLNIDLRIHGNYNRQAGYYEGVNPAQYALQTTRTITPGDFYPLGVYIGSEKPVPPPITFNMLNELASTENNSSTRSLEATLTLEYKLARGLLFRSTSNATSDASEMMSAAYDRSFYISDRRGWGIDYTPSDKQKTESQIPFGGIATTANRNTLVVTTRNMLDYTTGFFKDRDLLNVSAGNEITSATVKGVDIRETGYFPDRGMTFSPTEKGRKLFGYHTITNAVDNTMSFFGTATYSMNRRYVLSATVRSDGSNSFGQYSNARFLPNYGLAARWNAGSEAWLTNSRIISGLNFRVTYGTQGNTVKAVGPSLIASYPEGSAPPDLITGVPQLKIKSLPYPELRWEKTYQWNFGVDLSLFNGRAALTADYYMKKGKDLLVQKEIALEYGVNEMYKNGGEMTNKGLELTLNLEILRKKNMGASVRFINSRNLNRVVSSDLANDISAYLNGRAFKIGKPVSGFYSFPFTGLNPVNGAPLFRERPKTGITDTLSLLSYSGQLQPKFNGSFSTTFRYKNFTLNADFYYALGHQKRLDPLFNSRTGYTGVPTSFYNVSDEFNYRWRKPGDELITDIPAVYSGLPQEAIEGLKITSYVAYNQSDIRVVNNNFLRCRSLQLNYLVPAYIFKGSGIRGLSAGLNVSNVFTIANSRLRGQDPEIDGVGTSALPITRSYTFTMNVNF